MVGSALWFFAPEYQKDKVVGIFSSGSDERKCFNFYKDDFKDPSSAYFVNSYIWSKENELKYSKPNYDPIFDKYDSILRVEAQAKNGFGAYGPVHVECPLVDGKFNKHAARMRRIDVFYK